MTVEHEILNGQIIPPVVEPATSKIGKIETALQNIAGVDIFSVNECPTLNKGIIVLIDNPSTVNLRLEDCRDHGHPVFKIITAMSNLGYQLAYVRDEESAMYFYVSDI